MNINITSPAMHNVNMRTAGHSNLYVKNSYVNSYMKQQNRQGNQYGKTMSAEGEEETSLRKMMYERRKKDKNTDFYSKFAESSADYMESLRADRTKKKKTDNKVKKLHYNFKSISSQIMKCKTSVNARQVAGKAKREVVRLRQKKLSAQYDPDEVQIALTHALRIERVAKKKVKHLQEEEMVKVTGGPCAGEMEEDPEEKKTEEAEGAIAAIQNGASPQDVAKQQQLKGMSPEEKAEYIQEQMEIMQEMMQEQLDAMQEQMQAQMEQMQAQMQYEMQKSMEEMQEEMQAKMEDMMSEFMEEMADSMEELLEESGLSELLDEMMGGCDMEMDPADFHMMKLKHRAKELKEIAEADAEYLKAVFDRLEKMKGSALQEFGKGADNNAMSFAAMPAGGGVVSVSTESAAEIVHDSIDIDTGSASADTGGASVSAPVMIGASIDVSV